MIFVSWDNYDGSSVPDFLPLTQLNKIFVFFYLFIFIYLFIYLVIYFHQRVHSGRNLLPSSSLPALSLFTFFPFRPSTAHPLLQGRDKIREIGE